MINLKFEIEIGATREKIWQILWNEKTYNQWTTPFSPSSQVKSEWIEGGEVLFHDGNECGMFSVIERLDAPAEMVFRHKGMIENGVTTMFGDDTEWKESREGYWLTPTETGTHLRVEVETTENFADFMNDAFPKALGIIKELSE